MHRRHLLTLAGTTLLAAPALAHGPVRQKVEETVEIAAPPEKIWAVIGDFHDMSWNPEVAKTEGEGGNTVGAKRSMVLKRGGELDQELTKYDATGFSYAVFMPHNDVKVMPVTNFSSQLSVKPGDGGKSVVEWRGAFYRGYPNNDPPPELNEAVAIKAVQTWFRAGLDALKTKMEGSS